MLGTPLWSAAQSAWGKVRAALRQSAGGLYRPVPEKEPRHTSYKETRHRDGSLTARYRLSNTVEIKSWVLGFGANAIVLEPESLRDEIAAELEQSLKAYRVHGDEAGTRQPLDVEGGCLDAPPVETQQPDEYPTSPEELRR